MNKGSIGDFIKQRRNELNITQQELADKINTSRENLSKWERGLAIPHTEYLKNLSEFLKVSVADLISGKINSNEEVDDVIVDIIDRNHKNKVMFIHVIIATIAVFIIAFLSYYFISNYNKIKVYTLDTESENYDMDESILLVLKDNIYFMLGDVYDISDKDNLKHMELYYLNGNDKRTLYEGESIPRYIKIPKGNTLKTILENTYLELQYDNNETKTLKIDFYKRKSNDELFEDKVKNNDHSPNFYFDNIEIPDLSNFDYNPETEKFIYKNKDISFEYSVITNNLSILYNKEGYYETITFIGKNSNKFFYNINGEKECMITYENEKIITNNCQNNNSELEMLLKKYHDFIG